MKVCLRKVGSSLITAAVLCSLTSSCNSFLYEEEEECPVSYSVKFRYDLNMKWADAFANEVKSVHLYAFDKNGTLVWQGAEKGDALASDGYKMDLPLEAGDYRLLAWCGLDNNEETSESFTVPEARIGVTRIEELSCRLNRQYDSIGAYSKDPLYSLFHGMLDVNLPANEEGGEYIYTMPLTKNTNHIRIILQHLSGEPVNVNDFTFRIVEENGLMAHDNSLLSDEIITYLPYNLSSGTASMGPNDYPEAASGQGLEALSATSQTSVSVAIADISTARLMAGRKTYLIIEKVEGGDTPVACIPLTDYALLLKDGYGHKMTDQEYLDREDEYALTFFLDRNKYWIGTSIIINSWKLVLNNGDFK